MTRVLLSTERSSRTSCEGHDLLSAVLHAVGDGEVEAGFAKNFLADFDVGAFHADDHWDLDAQIFSGGDNAGCQNVATQDAAEDVDENGADAGIAHEDAE